MKIAFINKYQNKVNRGAETFVFELAKRLSKNHQVDILTKINLFKRYDIVIPTNGRLQAYITRILTWLTNSKMIISGQSGVGLDDRLNLYSIPDVFVAISSYALEKSKKINPFVKSVYIPNGVDLDKFTFQVRNLEAKKTILSVGAFTDEKRHDLTINAVSKIPNIRLMIVAGGGDKEVEITNLGKKTLGSRFGTFKLKHDDMPDIYSKADLFVFPTVRWESFGIVLVEAMASGLPVVATDDPIRREIIGEAGLFVDPTDTDAYTNAIEKALNTNWGDLPRKQAEKFSWDKIAEEYEKLFKSL